MESPIRIALFGFSAFERSAFESFFRLAGRRTPSYALTQDAKQAKLVVVDADNAAAMSQSIDFVRRSVSIGSVGREGELARMPRPINMMALLKVLDGLVGAAPAGARPAAASAPAASATGPVSAARTTSNAAAAWKPAPMATARVTTAPPSWAQSAPRSTGFGSLSSSTFSVAKPAVEVKPPPTARPAPVYAPVPAPAPKPAEPTFNVDHILVVDDSDIALRFMANCLGGFGFEVSLARSGEEALQRVSEANYKFVFLDVTMEGIDGYQTCKLIKKRPYTAGRKPPTVVMLTSRGGMVDKMRGTLAGCDGYLTKPLQQNELLKIIGDRIAAAPAESESKSEAESSRQAQPA